MAKAPADVIKVSCPSCSASYKVPAAQDGKKIRCQKCGEVFRISAGGGGGKKASSRTKARPQSSKRAAKPESKRARTESKREAAKPEGKRARAESKRAAAKPESKRAKAKPAKQEKPAKGGRGGKRGGKKGKRGAAAEEELPQGRKRRKGIGGPTKKPSGSVVMLSIVGLIACAVVLALAVMGEGEKKDTGEETASTSSSVTESFDIGSNPGSLGPLESSASSEPASSAASSSSAPSSSSQGASSSAASSSPVASSSSAPPPSSKPAPAAGPRKLDYPRARSLRDKMEKLEEDWQKVYDDTRMIDSIKERQRAMSKEHQALVMLNVLMLSDHQKDEHLTMCQMATEELTILFQIEDEGYRYDPTPMGTASARKTIVARWFKLWDEGKLK